MRKGVSPIISAVIVIVLVFIIAGMVVPWYYNLTRDITNSTGSSALRNVRCQNAGYDFDTSFGNFGVNHNFSGANDTLEVKIVNTGQINLYNFSIQVELDAGSSVSMEDIPLNSTAQITRGNPLKPGESTLLKGNITEDLSGTLTGVKVRNDVCSSVSIKQEF